MRTLTKGDYHDYGCNENAEVQQVSATKTPYGICAKKNWIRRTEAHVSVLSESPIRSVEVEEGAGVSYHAWEEKESDWRDPGHQ